MTNIADCLVRTRSCACVKLNARFRSIAALSFAAAVGLGAAPLNAQDATPAASNEVPLRGRPALLYREVSTVTLPSTDSDWDYVRFEPGSSRLFLARDKDGLTVYDVDRNELIATVANSVGANGPLLLPSYDRGYSAMTDGSLLRIELKSLRVLDRKKLDDEVGLNSGVYNPTSKTIHFITGTGEKNSIWYTLDPESGKLLSKTVFPFRKMDDPVFDAKGNIFAPARRDSIILRLNARTLREEARWNVGCNVSKLHYQASTDRILGACVGDNPSIFILNPNSGEVTARVVAGRGLDCLAVDDERHRIVTSNGIDGTLTVVAQDGPDKLRFLGTVNTSVGSRMMDIDHRNGNLYVVNAETTIAPDVETGELKSLFHPDSFRVRRLVPE